MPYRVELSSRALHDLDVLYFEKNLEDSHSASLWFNGLQEAVDSLELLPNRCPVAPESKTTGRVLRQLFYGNKPHTYRIIFSVDEDLQVVKILHIRHGARENL